MKVLVFGYWFPNQVRPHAYPFVIDQTLHLKDLVDLKVIAPVPWFPPIPGIKRWNCYWQIPKHENWQGLEVIHPRFPLFPRNLFKKYIGRWMYLSTRDTVHKLYKQWQFDLIQTHASNPSG
ncbi:MAG: hypothetical protein K8S56_10930, partial [Candidatus Cloacimonetes bacterium]|nr:hypothetical protein [Candidatus Cloacimonadota bacterium]